MQLTKKRLWSIGVFTFLIWTCSASILQLARVIFIDIEANWDKDNQLKDTYTINLDASQCDIDIQEKLNTKSVYEEKISLKKQVRTITINHIANHQVGVFPNSGNPNRIKPFKFSKSIPLNPQIASHPTIARGYDTGILFSGVSIEPFTAEFFIGPLGHLNRAWNITTLTTTENLGLDCNNAHVQPTGRYHYHGTPSAYLASINFKGDQMVKLGYAADGFPIYYKFGFDDQGNLIAHQSGYRLKTGNRPGDGITAPDGIYNGRYFNDYEYDSELSDLDACNGRWGKTPESDHEYYYVITDNFPSVPICFSGTPSADFRKGRGPGPGHRRPPPHQRPGNDLRPDRG